MIYMWNRVEEINDDLYRDVSEAIVSIEKTDEDIAVLSKQIAAYQNRQKAQRMRKEAQRPKAVKINAGQRCDIFLGKHLKELAEMK